MFQVELTADQQRILEIFMETYMNRPVLMAPTPKEWTYEEIMAREG